MRQAADSAAGAVAAQPAQADLTVRADLESLAHAGQESHAQIVSRWRPEVLLIHAGEEPRPRISRSTHNTLPASCGDASRAPEIHLWVLFSASPDQSLQRSTRGATASGDRKGHQSWPLSQLRGPLGLRARPALPATVAGRPRRHPGPRQYRDLACPQPPHPARRASIRTDLQGRGDMFRLPHGGAFPWDIVPRFLQRRLGALFRDSNDSCRSSARRRSPGTGSPDLVRRCEQGVLTALGVTAGHRRAVTVRAGQRGPDLAGEIHIFLPFHSTFRLRGRYRS